MRTLILALLVLLGTVFVVTSASKTEADAAAVAEHVKKLFKPKDMKVTKNDKVTVNGKAKGVKSSKKIAEEMDVTDYKDAKMGVLRRGFYGFANYADDDTTCSLPITVTFQRVNMCGPSFSYYSEALTVLGRWQKGSDDITVNLLTSSFDTDSCENMATASGYTAAPLDMCSTNGLGFKFSTHIMVDLEDFVPPSPGVVAFNFQSKKGCENLKEKDLQLVNFYASSICIEGSFAGSGNHYRYECDANGVPTVNYYSTADCTGAASSSISLDTLSDCAAPGHMLYSCMGPASRKLRGEAN